MLSDKELKMKFIVTNKEKIWLLSNPDTNSSARGKQPRIIGWPVSQYCSITIDDLAI